MKTCEEITKDIDRATFERISLREKWDIRMHISVCKPCKVYFKDSKILDQLLKRKFRNLARYEFSVAEKQKMKDRLRNR